ncbi:MAG: hypothetical protein BWY76_01396 [bacterium ADurb.Bin429]|nr:MAG: hypothetical protein BWY76_01396 [bacterium ADurb.Bin429]
MRNCPQHDITTLLLACLLASLLPGDAAELPDLKTGGKDNGPVAILFLGPYVTLDGKYKAELSAQGAVYAASSYFDPLPDVSLKQFNVFVVDRLPHMGQELDVFGQSMLVYWANMRKIEQRVREGAGLLVYVNITDGGGANAGGWNKEMQPWGIQILQASIRDQARRIEPWTVYGAEMYYSWTENLVKHPVTDRLKRIYWPSVNMRWDDCYAAPPLICDKTWTPLVKAMPGATLARQIDDRWMDDPQPKDDPVLCATRQVGKGRMAVLSIHPWYTHQMGNSKVASKQVGEMSPGVIDGIILNRGDGQVPSDTGMLVSRLYAWLAGNSAAAGLGGYRTGAPIAKGSLPLCEEEMNFSPVLDFDNLKMPPSWRHRGALVRTDDNQYYPEVSDPLVTGELRYFKALIGARTKLSDGRGTVADYAKAAKKAGYALIVFTETFGKLTLAEWKSLVAQCAKASSDDFVCLPGYDIQDPAGNHFVLIAPPEYPRASWLTADGTRLEKTQMVNFLFYNHMVVCHRPAAGPLPYERLKHFQGLSVYTYRNGMLVDDGLKAYQWKVESGSNPHPIVVHELNHPSEVAQAAKHGFQQLIPSDTVRNAVAYFRIGTPHFFEAPARYMISEGPVVTTWVSSPKDIGPAAEHRDQFRVAVGVRSDAPLATVELYDGRNLLRRWRPGGKEFQATADFRHSRQYDLFVIAEDTQHRRVITNAIRTVAERYHYRCGDRQNWLSDVGFHNCYTGSRLPDGLDFIMPVKGTMEGSSLFPNVRGTLMAPKISFPFTCNDVVVQDVLLDEKYTRALMDEVGLDAMPSLPSEPSTVYEARRRNYSFTPGRDGKRWIVLTEYEITLKRDVELVNPAGLFPAFSGLRNTRYHTWKEGKLFGEELAGNVVRNLPVGALAGGFIAMSPELQVCNGQFGLAPQPGTPARLPAGTKLTARFLYAYYGFSPYAANWKASYAFEDDPEGLLRGMGFAGPTPYQLTMTRGTLDRIAYLAEMTPDRYGVAGQVTKTAELLVDVPMQLRGVNANWPAGIWHEDGTLAYTGIFEATAWPRLDVSKPGKFYAGNLLTASNPDLVLSIVQWTKDRINLEVHNPTDIAITATITSPAEITGYKALKHTLTIPAGTTTYVSK